VQLIAKINTPAPVVIFGDDLTIVRKHAQSEADAEACRTGRVVPWVIYQGPDPRGRGHYRAFSGSVQPMRDPYRFVEYVRPGGWSAIEA
jgi:hypothetical protein